MGSPSTLGSSSVVLTGLVPQEEPLVEARVPEEGWLHDRVIILGGSRGTGN